MPYSPASRDSNAAARPASGTLWLAAHPAEVSAARAHLRRTLRTAGVDAGTTEDAELLVSELVTNVIRHSTSARAGLQIAVTDEDVSVHVLEDNRSGNPTHAHADRALADLDANHGRGVGILDQLTSEWGVTRRAEVTTTWFVVARPSGTEPFRAAADAPLVTSLQSALGRSQALLRIVESLSRAASADEIAEAVTRTVRGHVDAVFSGIALPDATGATMSYLSLDPLPAPTKRDWSTFDLTRVVPVGAAFLNNAAYFHEDRAAAEAAFPGLADHMQTAGTSALAHLPLVVEGQAIGTLCLAWSRPRVLDADLRAFLLIVAGYAAQALARRVTRAS
ncbi:ATP-binding protein [uncultured Jatrophihabitans sp.]|uniref:ATP-binding protein n=1 Tax=uncultured Jatrophihabitans sp. TaxID=1610747 RepID=UPI0035CC03A2